MQLRIKRWLTGPYITVSLIAICVVIYGLMTLMGGSNNLGVLIEFGAKYNPLIQQGQWWRFLTPTFLHIGIEHLVLNMVTLYFLGYQIEALFGHWRFLTIFLLSGIGGNLASFAFNPNALSAGASTAIFGLFGAFLMLGESFWENPYIRQMTKTFLLFIGLNLVMGFFSPGTDLAGHFGGLAAGFFAGYIVGAPKIGQISFIKRIIAVIVIILMMIGLYYYGGTL
ncbi:rhomboid family intramembrane serine protease [Secundilactobacillus similis]|uniref:Membrane-associated serine protease n=1 Tax=Secundilactobacillus similis DSM 23365 = JCM 2765 TaxID=1423804 RepID=A0A0R2F3B7_9LACO|nr:rhomboid family intramembrane serine protease [Secundilactobacillus similis]KRN22920.1 membrane-associated serine protease [Secundilactobacillus similis DSM 23365 = JCM 2765]